MVLQNICFMLNQFIRCSAYENVIFCWVMHEQSIIDAILNGIEAECCEIKNISLVCNEETLRARLQKDIDRGNRAPDILGRSIARIPLYQKLNTAKVVTDEKSVSGIADEITRGEV